MKENKLNSFSPPFLQRNAHFQTIAANLLGRLPGYSPKNIGLLNENAIVETSCGTKDKLFLQIHRLTGRIPERTPAIILVHGLEGSSNSIYMIKIAGRLLLNGFHAIRMNLRGCGKGMELADKIYNAGLTIDIETAVNYVRNHVSQVVGIIGFSLGANMVLKYLGEDLSERHRQIRNWNRTISLKKKIAERAHVFVAVSPPLDLRASMKLLDSPAAIIYRKMFLSEMKKRVIPQGKFDHIPDARKKISKVNFWFDFDDLFMAPTGGFKGAHDYYKHCSSINYLPNIKIPGLVLHARDDPIVGNSIWNDIKWDDLPHLTPHLTMHGGHLGWRARRDPLYPDRRWMDYRVINYLLAWKNSLEIEKK